jgi:hypothetical protein
VPRFVVRIGLALAEGNYLDRFAAIVTVLFPIDLILSIGDLRRDGVLPGFLLSAVRSVLFSALLAALWNVFRRSGKSRSETRR